MQTGHMFISEDSRQLGAVKTGSIDLVVTSPPYPMIEMWDEQFAKMNPYIGPALNEGDCSRAFEAMHSELDRVWTELNRVMKAGALACINVGDATRTINDRFQLFANHARIQNKFFALGFDVLPAIIWRKQTNAPNKFMGSGMLPAGAYVTLEHEFILLFRKGSRRIFDSTEDKLRRRQSAYFWEERNAWFSDLWDFKGTRQDINNRKLRSRSAAYPFALPFRLINMYSVFGDTVLDPFSGTGTTALAAMAAGRDSVNCELEEDFYPAVKDRIAAEGPGLSIYNRERVSRHLEFVAASQKANQVIKHSNRYFGFPVKTAQEQELKLLFTTSVVEVESGLFQASYLEDKFAQTLDLDQITLEEPDIGQGASQLRLF